MNKSFVCGNFRLTSEKQLVLENLLKRMGENMIKVEKLDNHLHIIVPSEWNGITIDDLLKNRWQLAKKRIHQMRMGKVVKQNGLSVPFANKLRTGDQLVFENIFFEADYGNKPSPKPVQILFEDDFLLIANKPAHVTTHPNASADTDTLANRIVHYLAIKNESAKVQHIHRLDKDTSGAVLFAKSSFIGGILDKQLEERKIKRTYMAIVHGKLQENKGTINAPIGRDRHHPTRRRISNTGQSAVTHYEVIGFDAVKNLSQIVCRLDTGRTHQIRVHLSSIGHPLVGDVLYGGKPLFYRQALHAKYLSFIHPLTMEKIDVEAPYLDDFPELTGSGAK